MVEIPARALRLRKRERLRELRSLILISSNWLSIPLYALFIGADYLLAPTQLLKFIAIRAIIIPSCLIVNFSVKRTRRLMTIQAFGALYVFVNAFLITILSFLAGGKSSPYYAGLNLCAISVGSFIPWTRKALVANLCLIYGPFCLLSMIAWSNPGTHLLLVNSFFMISTVLITLVIRHFNEKYRIAAIVSKVRLDEELNLRAEIIKIKTREALNLADLAKQFSPQIVHAIKLGEMQISDAVRESPICVMFIDIVDSTSVMAAIGLENYQNALNLFISLTIPILFKYDITYDKMIGDAVMAFSNEPAKRADFASRVASACLEIRETVENRNLELRVYWGRAFELKIGIATGLARVGFQGGAIKSYTANGMVVNISNRLCSAASPGEILMDQGTVESLPLSMYNSTYSGKRNLKGVGDCDIHKLRGNSGSVGSGWSEIETRDCPLCAITLHIEENSEHIFVLKCRNCSFVMSADSSGGRSENRKAA